MQIQNQQILEKCQSNMLSVIKQGGLTDSLFKTSDYIIESDNFYNKNKYIRIETATHKEILY